jgi:hypothetical protein
MDLEHCLHCPQLVPLTHLPVQFPIGWSLEMFIAGSKRPWPVLLNLSTTVVAPSPVVLPKVALSNTGPVLTPALSSPYATFLAASARRCPTSVWQIGSNGCMIYGG